MPEFSPLEASRLFFDFLVEEHMRDERSFLLFLLSLSERLMDTRSVSAPFLVPQHELLYLPGGGLGEITELDGCGALEVGQSSTTEFDDLCFGRRLP